MAIRVEEMLSARLVPRTEDVPVPDLASWADGKPTWKVRGLNANELVKVDLANRRNDQKNALLAAFDGSMSEITDATKAFMGKGATIESEYVRWLKIFELGAVDPPGSEEVAVFLGENYPVVLKQLINTILALSGKGAEPEKKPSGCGETAE
jgi:hypothetical protein